VWCVCDMYIQRCKHVPKHSHIHTLIHTLMYVEVSNIIIVCNQHVPHPNRNEQTPDVVGGRLWYLSGSWDYVADRKERAICGSLSSVLRTPEAGFPSGAPKEEFGWMVFEKKSSLWDRTKVQSTPLVAARGGEARRRNVLDSAFIQA